MTDLQQLAHNTIQLANLRQVVCYAVAATRVSLPSSPAALLAQQPGPRRLLWSGNEWQLAQGIAGRFAVSGPGRGSLLAAAHAKLGERCLCLGDDGLDIPLASLALSFENQARGAGAWGSNLPGAEAVLPQCLWWKKGRIGYRIATVAVSPGDTAQRVARVLEQLLDGKTIKSAEPDTNPWRPLAAPAYQDLVREALPLLRMNALRKVVLARAVDVPRKKRVDPEALITQLRSEADKKSTVYWFDLPGKAAFVGTTPELLFSLEHTTLETMALAGSRPRGSNPTKDRTLAKALLANTKERKEHNLVVEHISHVLQGRANKLNIPGTPSIRKLPRVQHLESTIHGNADHSDPFDLLAALHPTPAVCGLPTQAAADYILRCEGLHRGLYAGVLGFVARNSCRLIVPLRGGIVSNKKARLFAGAGIVETSDPQAEFEETELKLSLMRAVLAAT